MRSIFGQFVLNARRPSSLTCVQPDRLILCSSWQPAPKSRTNAATSSSVTFLAADSSNAFNVAAIGGCPRSGWSRLRSIWGRRPKPCPNRLQTTPTGPRITIHCSHINCSNFNASETTTVNCEPLCKPHAAKRASCTASPSRVVLSIIKDIFRQLPWRSMDVATTRVAAI